MKIPHQGLFDIEVARHVKWGPFMRRDPPSGTILNNVMDLQCSDTSRCWLVGNRPQYKVQADGMAART